MGTGNMQPNEVTPATSDKKAEDVANDAVQPPTVQPEKMMDTVQPPTMPDVYEVESIVSKRIRKGELALLISGKSCHITE